MFYTYMRSVNVPETCSDRLIRLPLRRYTTGVRLTTCGTSVLDHVYVSSSCTEPRKRGGDEQENDAEPQDDDEEKEMEEDNDEKGRGV